MMPDFSELPDVVWVRILSFLNLHERAKVCETCQRLNSMFSHPSLWSTVSLNCERYRYANTDSIEMSQECVQMISRYGKYFKSLKITFFDYMTNCSDNRHAWLKTLAPWTLEKLTLHIDVVIIRKGVQRRTSEFDGVLYLIQNSTKLKSMDVVRWPMHYFVSAPNILQVIQTNGNLVSLESLCLFWNGTSSSDWEPGNNLMPEVEETMNTVKILTNLTTLKLRSCMISSQFIDELANPKRVPLKRLSILITYSKVNRNRHIPNIEGSSWSRLIKQSPNVDVDFTVHNRVPVHELFIFLKAGIPVTSLQFLKYSECKEDILHHVAATYGRTLQKFKDYGFPSMAMDDAVVKLISSCPTMNYFVFNGKLQYSTVAYLAKLKGPKWRCFQVSSENVITTEPQEEPIDDDILIRKNRDGSVDILRAPEMLQSELDRQGVLEVMIQEVSEYLEKAWIPMDIKD